VGTPAKNKGNSVKTEFPFSFWKDFGAFFDTRLTSLQ